MKETNGGALRSIAWTEIFPWLSLYRTFRLAFGFRALMMSAVAVLLTVTMWSIFAHVFSCRGDNAGYMSAYRGCPWKELTDRVGDSPEMRGGPQWIKDQAAPSAATTSEGMKNFAARMAKESPVYSSWMFLSRPMWEGFGMKVTFLNICCLICCGLSSLAIWSFFGAAITRIASVQLAANERITLGAALRFACSKFFSYFFAPLWPLVGVALAALPVLLFGLLLKFGVSAFFVGLIWPVFLVCGLIITLLLLGLIFGWPLMWPTISTEGSDCFDAFNRSYSYVFQRPLHYLFYVVVASVLGLLGWFLVKNFAAAIVWATYWSASWGAGADRVQAIMSGDISEGWGHAGAMVIHFWTGIVKLLAVGFGFSFFWNAYAAIYLLLRRDADATEMDEVYLDADESESKFGLPKIVLDDAGAPEVQDNPPAEAKASAPTPPPADE